MRLIKIVLNQSMLDVVRKTDPADIIAGEPMLEDRWWTIEHEDPTPLVEYTFRHPQALAFRNRALAAGIEPSEFFRRIVRRIARG